MGLTPKTLVEMFVVALIGAALLPSVAEYCATAALSLVGISSTLVGLVPVFYTIALLLGMISWAVTEYRGT